MLRFHVFFLALSVSLLTSGFAQSQLSLVQLQQDVDALSRNVGKLQLTVDVLERDNAQLKSQLNATTKSASAIEKRLVAFEESVETRLARLPEREAALRRELVEEVRSLIVEVTADLEKQVASAASASTSPTKPPITFDDNFPKDGLIYKVQPGDTMSAIAAHHKSKVIWIQKANKIADPTRLMAGQEIFVPQASE